MKIGADTRLFPRDCRPDKIRDLSIGGMERQEDCQTDPTHRQHARSR